MKPAGKPMHRGEVLRDTARKILAIRKLRSSFLPAEMFGEAGWEILLALYTAREAAGRTARQVEASSVAPTTTTRRWLKYLEHEKLITRRAGDGRTPDQLQLTGKAWDALDRLLQEF